MIVKTKIEFGLTVLRIAMKYLAIFYVSLTPGSLKKLYGYKQLIV